MSSTQPKVITKSDPTRIAVTWADGHETVYPTAVLRRICPCAACVSEVTGLRTLDPASIPDDLVHNDVNLVGNYAICVHFGDHHNSGIFPFRFLRENDPGDA